MSAPRPDPELEVRDVDPPVDARERFKRTLIALGLDIIRARQAERRARTPKPPAPRV